MGTARKEIVTRTKQIVDEDEDGTAENDNDGVGLFDFSDIKSKKIDRVRVYRKDPEEGFLGEVEPDATEETIAAKWGGSVYRVVAKNAKSQVVQVRTLRIAGDPMFVSEAAEIAWRRQKGLPAQRAQGAAATEGLGLKDVLVLLEQLEGKRSSEMRAKQEADQRWAEEREDRRRKEEEDREERRQRLAREDEDRRARQHAQDLERIKADTDRMLQSQTQAFTQTLALFKAEAKTDPVEQLMKGIELARSLGGGGAGSEPANPLMAIFARAPEILRELRATAGAAAGEMHGDDQGGEEEEAAQGGDSLTLTGRTAKLLRAVGQRMAAQGKDPELALSQLAALYLKSTATPKPVPAVVAPVAPAPAPAPPAKVAPVAAAPAAPAGELAKPKANGANGTHTNGVKLRVARPKRTSSRKPSTPPRS